jgi:hypothetical protein
MYQLQLQELQKQKDIQQRKQQQQQPQYHQQPQIQQYQKKHNQMDIERSQTLYQQKYIKNNYQVVSDDNEDDTDETDETDDTDENNDDNDFIKKKNYQFKTNFITISSMDRNWIGNDPNISQYNFQLKFSPSANSISNRPLYYNNPTIPATPSQASNGLRGDPNIAGCVSNDGTMYNAYQSNQPYGEIVDYEKIIEQGQKGLALSSSFKNIVSIELISVMFPAVQRRVEYHPTLIENAVQETYYSIEIEEVRDVMKGTSRDLQNSFAILTPAIRIYDISSPSAKSIEYRVAGTWAKQFIPTPLSSLTNLSIQIKKPSGDILANMNDTLDIKFIYQYTELTPADARADVLVIETTEYFSDKEYNTSDTILIRNYSHYASTTQNCQNFNDFMNRQKGHKILSTSNDDPAKFLKNRIHIARPAYLDKKTGGLTEESWYTTFKNTVLDNDTTIDDITTFDTGRLINIDLQNVYFFKITTKEQSMSLETERV